MVVCIRDIKAKCQCGETEYTQPHDPPYAEEDFFACSACGAQARYGALLEQIGEEAIRQAVHAVSVLRLRHDALKLALLKKLVPPPE